MNATARNLTMTEASELANSIIDTLDNNNRNVHQLHFPGSVELTSIQREATQTEEGIDTTDWNPEIVHIGIMNGLNSFVQAALRANSTSTYCMSGAALKLAAPSLVATRVPMTDELVDVQKLLDAIIDAGKQGEFCPGPQQVNDKLLSTYFVLRRIITCIMKEFALMLRDPQEKMVKDETGLFISLTTGRDRWFGIA